MKKRTGKAPSAAIKKQFKDLVAAPYRAEIAEDREIHDNPARLARLDSFIGETEYFIGNYVFAYYHEEESSFDPEELDDLKDSELAKFMTEITPEEQHAIELRRFQDSFFGIIITEAAQLLGSDPVYIADACGYEFQTLFDKYTLDLGDSHDIPLIQITQHILNEAQEFRRVLAHEERHVNTQISLYSEVLERTSYLPPLDPPAA